MTLTGSVPPATSEDKRGQNPNLLVTYAPAATDAPTSRNRRLVVTSGKRMKGTPNTVSGAEAQRTKEGGSSQTRFLNLSLSLRIETASNVCTARSDLRGPRNK